MPQTKKEKQIKAWESLVYQIKYDGGLTRFDKAKHLRSLIGMDITQRIDLFYQEEIAQLHGYIHAAVNNKACSWLSLELAAVLRTQAKRFTELTVSQYREAVMMLWSHRQELINPLCPIGSLRYEMHFYEYNYSDLCRLHMPNQQSHFAMRHAVEEEKSKRESR